MSVISLHDTNNSLIRQTAVAVAVAVAFRMVAKHPKINPDMMMQRKHKANLKNALMWFFFLSTLYSSQCWLYDLMFNVYG